MKSITCVLAFNSIDNTEFNELLTDAILPLSCYECIYFSPNQFIDLNSDSNLGQCTFNDTQIFTSEY